MLSVIIATLNSERALLPTLKELVPGAMEGLVSEVVIADGGSHDDTAIVADIAGCTFVAGGQPLALRLKEAAATARAPWLLFLRPGIVLDAPWTGEVRHFLKQPPTSLCAAVFRRVPRDASALRQISSILAAALRRQPGPEQGLLIPKHFYQRIGGHRAGARDPETELLGRIGRRRLTTLSCGAVRLDT